MAGVVRMLVIVAAVVVGALITTAARAETPGQGAVRMAADRAVVPAPAVRPSRPFVRGEWRRMSRGVGQSRWRSHWRYASRPRCHLAGSSTWGVC
jgi:hypothetical protein